MGDQGSSPDFMEKNPSLDAKSCSASHEILVYIMEPEVSL